MSFTTTIITHQATSSAMIASTIGGRENCKEYVKDFDESSASDKETQTYEECVDHLQRAENTQTLADEIGPIGLSFLFIFVFVGFFGLVYKMASDDIDNGKWK